MDDILRLDNLQTGYAAQGSGKVVTSNINEVLKRGELVCLIGPNGAGKSTLMKTISGQQKPISGKVYLQDKEIHQIPPKVLAKQLSLVLTEQVSAGMLSAFEVVALGRYPHTGWAGTLSKRDHQIVREAISMAGADELMQRTLSELSDGERQKIMVARAFAQEPEIMILDEVTAFLDLPRRVEIMRLLQKMARETNKAILLSTHDMDLALRGSDRIWLLPKGGELATGSPEDLVIDGSFQSVFSSEGVQFDSQSGSFKIQAAYSTKASVIGAGEVATWTKRALERNGIEVTDGSPTTVTIEPTNHENTWLINHDGQAKTANSIYELINKLNSRNT